MITWLALGLLALVVVAAVVYQRRKDRETEAYLAVVEAHIPKRPESEPVQLSEEQTRDLKVTWGQLVCSSCGNVHGGMCPRVREIRYQVNGNFERVIFWPDDKWRLPEGTITPWDVFGAAGAPAPEKEEEK